MRHEAQQRPGRLQQQANFGQVEWNGFGAGQPTPTKFGKTTKGQAYPVDTAIGKPVQNAVTIGFTGP
jgi:hypothetical protein